MHILPNTHIAMHQSQFNTHTVWFSSADEAVLSDAISQSWQKALPADQCRLSWQSGLCFASPCRPCNVRQAHDRLQGADANWLGSTGLTDSAGIWFQPAPCGPIAVLAGMFYRWLWQKVDCHWTAALHSLFWFGFIVLGPACHFTFGLTGKCYLHITRAWRYTRHWAQKLFLTSQIHLGWFPWLCLTCIR